jgi:hypothetical protein
MNTSFTRNIAWFSCSKYDTAILRELVKKYHPEITLKNFVYTIENSTIHLQSNDWRLYCKSQKVLESMYINEMFEFLRGKYPRRFCYGCCDSSDSDS